MGTGCAFACPIEEVGGWVCLCLCVCVSEPCFCLARTSPRAPSHLHLAPFARCQHIATTLTPPHRVLGASPLSSHNHPSRTPFPPTTPSHRVLGTSILSSHSHLSHTPVPPTTPHPTTGPRYQVARRALQLARRHAPKHRLRPPLPSPPQHTHMSTHTSTIFIGTPLSRACHGSFQPFGVSRLGVVR
jgi:hypothetical protein